MSVYKNILYKHFLSNKGFTVETLNLLNNKNLRKLALEQGWKDVR